MKIKHLLTITLLLVSMVAIAQLKVGNNPTTINANSVLEIETTNKGMLLPRVALAATINVAPLSAHVAGMVVYNTATAGDVTPGYYYNNGAAWVRIADAAISNTFWKLSGNAATVDGTHFIGTTDNIPFNIRVNNEKAGRIDAAGQVFLGYQAGNINTATSNTGIGYQSLYLNTTGSNNTAYGQQSLYTNTTGFQNTAIGHRSLWLNTTGSNNTATGIHSLLSNTTGIQNTATGQRSLYTNTTGINNTANGYFALYSNIIGASNTATGTQALYTSTGTSNTANGYQSLYLNTTGNQNTAIGDRSLYTNTIGNNNTALGYYAFNTGALFSNSTAIGYNSNITASNQVRVGDAAVTSIGGQVGWTTLSDKRFKKDIKETVPGLAFITKLRPVTYYLDMDAIANCHQTSKSLHFKDAGITKEKILQSGFIAQEVEKTANDLGFIFSGVDKPKNENDYYGLRYAEFTVPLVKAIQEQQKMIEQQQTQNTAQQKTINSLQSAFSKLEKENELLNLKMDKFMKTLQEQSLNKMNVNVKK